MDELFSKCGRCNLYLTNKKFLGKSFVANFLNVFLIEEMGLSLIGEGGEWVSNMLGENNYIF